MLEEKLWGDTATGGFIRRGLEKAVLEGKVSEDTAAGDKRRAP